MKLSLSLIVLGACALLVALGWRSVRARRMLHLTRLSARLSTSWLGAFVRRLFASKERRVHIDEARRRHEAQIVTETMGHMKGAVMKLGQMMSFISDEIPPEYRAALASLRTAAPPMDFPLLRDVAERELGMPLERAFARFDDKPIASASIGQVHRAELPTGEEVAVKIQYPGVAEAIAGDLDNVAMLYQMTSAMFPALDPAPMVAEMRGRLLEELDYSREARSQRAFYDLYEDHPFIRVPRVYASHSTARVLTTEFVAARTFDEVLGDDEAARQRWSEILYRFVFGSMVRYHVFNGDPHPGNYLFGDDGRMVFLDFGCVKYFPEPMMSDWTQLVSAHLRGDRAGFRARLVRLGFLTANSPVDEALAYEYFAYFYEPFHDDREFAFTAEYNRKSLKLIFAPDGRFAGMQKKLNMPPDFVFANRIQWGVYSILGQLGARGNWHRIDCEHRAGAAPSTELGRIDHEYRERWRARRGLVGVDFHLSPDGPVRHEPPAPLA